MKPALKVFWTENAIQDLLVIKEFISQDSVDRAEQWVLELYFSKRECCHLKFQAGGLLQ